jgi:hypothetical protein
MAGQTPGADGSPGKYDYGAKTALALFDLEEDIGEANDVAAANPEVVARLSRLGDEMRAKLGDKLTEVVGADNREPGRTPAK